MKNDFIDAHFYSLLAIKHMKNEKFEKLDNEQKELVKYWIEKFLGNAFKTTETKAFIEKHLTPDFNPKVGTWYFTIDNESNEYLFNHQENGKSYGFFKGKWSDTTYWDTTSNWTNQPREATPEKVAQRLIEEAKRRGFVKGNRTFFMCGGENDLELCVHTNGSNYTGYGIFRSGKWAEIIDEKAEIRESVARLEAELQELKSKL